MGRTLIWPLLSTGAPRTGEEERFFRGVITGPLLTASLTVAGDFRITASACRCTKHLSKGRPPWPEGQDDCASMLARPRNSSVPPRRPFKTRGSSPKGGPVRSWLGGRAATRRSVTCVLKISRNTGAGAGGQSKHRGPGHRRQRGDQGSVSHHHPTPKTLARSWPQFGHQLPGTLRRSLGAGAAARRVFEVSRRPRPACYEAKNRLLSKTSCLRSR
jgi:hypothetical protein